MRFATPRLLLGIAALGVLPACAAALVGGLLYKSSKSKEQKQEFMTNLQRTNMEREARGLKALDWCSEAYTFDKGWAAEDTECAKRITRYEKGDKTALGIGGPGAAGASAPSSPPPAPSPAPTPTPPPR